MPKQAKMMWKPSEAPIWARAGAAPAVATRAVRFTTRPQRVRPALKQPVLGTVPTSRSSNGPEA